MKKTIVILLLLTCFAQPAKAMNRSDSQWITGTPVLSSKEQLIWQTNGYIPVGSWQQYDACVEQLLVQHPDKNIILFLDLDDTLVKAPKEHGEYPYSSEAFYSIATKKILDLLTLPNETCEKHVTDNVTAKKIAEQSLALFLFPYITKTKLTPVNKQARIILERYARNPRIRIYGLTSRARQYAKATACKLLNLGIPFSNQDETFKLNVNGRTVIFCKGIVFGAWCIKGPAAHALINHFGIAPESIGCVSLFDDSRCNVEPFTQVMHSYGIPTYNCLFTGRQREYEQAKRWFEQQKLPAALLSAAQALRSDYERLSPKVHIPRFDPTDARRETQSCVPSIKIPVTQVPAKIAPIEIPVISVMPDSGCPTPQSPPNKSLLHGTFYSLPIHGSSLTLLKSTPTNRPESPNPKLLIDSAVLSLTSPSIALTVASPSSSTTSREES